MIKFLFLYETIFYFTMLFKLFNFFHYFSLRVYIIKLIYIILFYIILSFFLNDNIIYCADEIVNDVSILDRPIRFETTPRKLGQYTGYLGISGLAGYMGYYGLKSGVWASEIFPGTFQTKGIMTATGLAIGTMYGLGIYAINRAHRPNFPITVEEVNPSNTGANNSANCPLEVGDIIFNPLRNLDPIAEDPNIALLSVSIILLIIGIQCFNFILLRLLLLRYASKISSLIKQPTLLRFFNKLILLFEKTKVLYVTGFTILGYISIIGGIIFLSFLLYFMS
jgi:hypothetical protein